MSASNVCTVRVVMCVGARAGLSPMHAFCWAALWRRKHPGTKWVAQAWRTQRAAMMREGRHLKRILVEKVRALMKPSAKRRRTDPGDSRWLAALSTVWLQPLVPFRNAGIGQQIGRAVEATHCVSCTSACRCPLGVSKTCKCGHVTTVQG